MDLIDRQAAIDAVRSYMADNDIEDSDWHAAGIVYEINRLPTAEPHNFDEWCDDCKEYDHERKRCPKWNSVIKATLEDAKPKTGRWVKMSDSYGTYHCCSRCGREGVRVWKYCPNCGAKMKEDTDETD